MRPYSKKTQLLVLILITALAACSSGPNSGDTNTVSNDPVETVIENKIAETQATNIEPPTEEVTLASEEVKIDFSMPIMGDATNIYYYDEMVSFQTKNSIEEIYEFYKTEMGNLGFTQGYKVLVADKLIARFEKGSIPIVVSTASDGSGGYMVDVFIVDE